MTSLIVPPLGESIVEATVARWLKSEGDSVAAGETVVELDTDKITVEVPAQRPGVLVKRAVNEGDVVKIGGELGTIDESAAAGASAPAAPQSAPEGTQQPATSDAAASSPPSDNTGTSKSAPAARRLADEKGIDISSVTGTGRGGVVSKPDVIAASAGTPPSAGAAATSSAVPTASSSTPAPKPVPQASITDSGEREVREKMTTRRKRIADNLLNSHISTARLTTFNEIDMSAVIALRGRVKESIEKKHGIRLSFMPFFIKAACMALKDYPVINAQIDDDHIIYKNYVNMGIAVASDQGLVVPNIKDADQKGLLQISEEMNEVAKRARDNKLTMNDLTGGSFTITNGGVFGSLLSTPIINYPQVAILGLHKTQDRPVAIDGKVEIRPMMYVAMSYDHRIIDGEQAVLFLVRVKELMEDPAAMLIS